MNNSGGSDAFREVHDVARRQGFVVSAILSESFAAAATLLIATVALLGEGISREGRLYRLARQHMRDHSTSLGPECQRATMPEDGSRTFLARADEFSVKAPWIYWQYHRALQALKVRWSWLYRLNPNGSHVWPEDPELYNTLQVRLAARGPARRARREIGRRLPLPLLPCAICGSADLAHHNYRATAANALWHLARLRTYQFSRRISLVLLALISLAWIASLALRAIVP